MCALAMFGLLLGGPRPAHADGPLSFTYETYSGADATRDVWLLYSGVTIAPFGGIYGNGVRLRASGGYGQYGYQGHRAGDPKGTKREFSGQVSYAEALVGYQAQFGALTAKAFAGIAAIAHLITPLDPIEDGGLLTQGLDYGVKGALELWLNLGSDAWTSLDASWTMAHQAYAGRWRIGYRVLPTVSLGLEAGINGHLLTGDSVLSDGSLRDPLRPQIRTGLFARYEWSSGEISASAGLANSAYDFTDNNGSVGGFEEIYGTINWLRRF